MVSYASGARYLSLIGGTCLALRLVLRPAAGFMTILGEQTDVPESDWYNSSYIAWGSNVPQTCTPDAHSQVRYIKGPKPWPSSRLRRNRQNMVAVAGAPKQVPMPRWRWR